MHPTFPISLHPALTTAEAARVAGVSTATMRRRIEDGTVPAQRLGRRGIVRIDPFALTAALMPKAPATIETPKAFAS